MGNTHGVRSAAKPLKNDRKKIISNDFFTVLLSLLGNIDLRTISNLTQKLDVPGGDALNNVSNGRKTRR